LIVIASSVLDNVTLLPATNDTSSVTPDPALPPDVNLIIFCDADKPSVAEMLYVVLLSGVVTEPPRGIETPFTLIPELTRAVFGIFEKILALPEIVQVLATNASITIY
jgi:hypothetical protein